MLKRRMLERKAEPRPPPEPAPGEALPKANRTPPTIAVSMEPAPGEALPKVTCTPPTSALSMNNDVVLRQRQMWRPSKVNLAGGEFGFLDLNLAGGEFGFRDLHP